MSRSHRSKSHKNRNTRTKHRSNSQYQPRKNFKPSDLPSHTDLLKRLNSIAPYILWKIFQKLNWKFYEIKKRLIGKNTLSITGFKMKVEEEGWDVYFKILETVEEKLEIEHDKRTLDAYKGLGEEHLLRKFYDIGIEYKSHNNEWNMQFDDFIRQIKKRSNKNPYAFPVLLSFDPKFKDFEDISGNAGFILITLPREIGSLIMNTNSKEEFEKKFYNLPCVKDYNNFLDTVEPYLNS